MRQYLAALKSRPRWFGKRSVPNQPISDSYDFPSGPPWQSGNGNYQYSRKMRFRTLGLAPVGGRVQRVP